MRLAGFIIELGGAAGAAAPCPRRPPQLLVRLVAVKVRGAGNKTREGCARLSHLPSPQAAFAMPKAPIRLRVEIFMCVAPLRLHAPFFSLLLLAPPALQPLSLPQVNPAFQKEIASSISSCSNPTACANLKLMSSAFMLPRLQLSPLRAPFFTPSHEPQTSQARSGLTSKPR